MTEEAGSHSQVLDSSGEGMDTSIPNGLRLLLLEGGFSEGKREGQLDPSILNERPSQLPKLTSISP